MSCSFLPYFFSRRYGALRYLHSFPTRRSSDLAEYLLRLRVESLRLLAVERVDGLVYDAVELCALVASRSEEHTSELQSRVDLVCRLLLEKNKTRVLAVACWRQSTNQRYGVPRS